MPTPACASSLDALESRLRKLEVQNRRLRRGLLALALGLGLAAAPAWMPRPRSPLPAVLAARSFVVRDALGRRRLVLGTGANSGSGYLRLYTPDGHMAAELAVWPRIGPALRLLDGHRTPRLDLSYLTGIGSSLEFFDARGRRHLAIRLSGNDRPAIQLNDNAGRRLVLGSARVRLLPGRPPQLTPANALLRLGRHGRLLWQAPAAPARP